jgi:bifunctional UDP-N-acetylglucosamine pyrophosphorylase/glucosamine-1-phosphate N-acetyltransferase
LAYSKIKNVTLGVASILHEHCLIEHTEIGSRVMIGSGTRTINYDGKKQSECKIADNTFIGAGVNLIAPLTVGMGAYIAAGSTITDDVPVGALAIAREYQSNHDNWAKRRKR